MRSWKETCECGFSQPEHQRQDCPGLCHEVFLSLRYQLDEFLKMQMERQNEIPKPAKTYRGPQDCAVLSITLFMFFHKPYLSGFQVRFLRTAALASFTILWKKQILRPHRRPSESKTEGETQQFVTKPSRCFWRGLKCEKGCFILLATPDY